MPANWEITVLQEKEKMFTEFVVIILRYEFIEFYLWIPILMMYYISDFDIHINYLLLLRDWDLCGGWRVVSSNADTGVAGEGPDGAGGISEISTSRPIGMVSKSSRDSTGVTGACISSICSDELSLMNKKYTKWP